MRSKCLVRITSRNVHRLRLAAMYFTCRDEVRALGDRRLAGAKLFTEKSSSGAYRFLKRGKLRRSNQMLNIYIYFCCSSTEVLLCFLLVALSFLYLFDACQRGFFLFKARLLEFCCRLSCFFCGRGLLLLLLVPYVTEALVLLSIL